jgi:hypothetical protein
MNNNKLKENLPGINRSLRNVFDSDDPIRMGLGYHGFQRNGGRGGKQRPKWVDDPAAIQKFFLRSFPKLQTNQNQRSRAARWAYIIELYWNRGLTRGKIVLELGLTWGQVHSTIRAIKRAAGELSCNGSGKNRKRGRPMKNRALSAASIRV